MLRQTLQRTLKSAAIGATALESLPTRWSVPWQSPLLSTVTRCLSSRKGDNDNDMFDSSLDPLGQKPKFMLPRIRRPMREAPIPLSQTVSRSRGRPHSIALFPGDFADADESWDSDDDDDNTERVGGFMSFERTEDLDSKKETSKGFFDDSDDDDEEGDEAIEMELMGDVLRKRQAEDMANKARWKRNAMAPERFPEVDSRGRAYGRGGRKTATARVWVQPGPGTIVINRKDFVDYFPRLSDREFIMDPLCVTATCGKMDVTAHVQGGGVTGQAGAIRFGLARALMSYDPELFRPVLKRLGMLRRDTRVVERKKIGKLKARKAPQWVRR
jgi:small subunit ribosomal protein S9